MFKTISKGDVVLPVGDDLYQIPGNLCPWLNG